MSTTFFETATCEATDFVGPGGCPYEGCPDVPLVVITDDPVRR